jgi:type II secretory pathway pseudopilin PulG
MLTFLSSALIVLLVVGVVGVLVSPVFSRERDD